jgi:branched-chain amino acid transport system substrate-binding protein
MRKRAIITISLILVGLFGVFYVLKNRGTERLTLALVGPMSGDGAQYGKAMLKGAELLLDEINAQGGINGRKLSLKVYDDQNNPELAKEVAEKIVKNQDVLAVLGHYYSTTTLAAAPIYEQAGIVMISASASDDTITRNHEWCFTTLPSSSFQGQFIAHYIRDVLEASSACVIYDEDVYGTTLSKSFLAEAEKIKMKINGTWSFSTKDSDFENDLFAISEEFKLVEEPDVVFFATHSKEGANLLALLKEPGTSFSAFGPDAFASSVFIETLDTFPQERSSPGYFSDNVFTIAPFILDVATQAGSRFAYKFEDRYNVKPDWISAGYHDAMILLENVFERADDSFSEDTIEEKRKFVQEQMRKFYDYNSSCQGLSGPIFFTPEGSIAVPRPIGVYRNQKIISTPYQYQSIDFSEYSKELLKEVLTRNVLLLRDRLMRRTRVVYTGVDINEITDFDLSTFTYTVDFYLWFRYQGEFSSEEIQFVNAVSPIELGEPLMKQELSETGVTTIVYRIKTSFKDDFMIKDYPFDKHTIQVKIRHKTQTRDKLIFVTDILGIRDFQDPEKTQLLHRAMETKSLNGWKVVHSLFFENTVINDSTLGMPKFFKELNTIEFSQFNAGVVIRRDVKAFALKNLLPIIIVMLLTYLSYYLSYEKAEMRISIGMSMLLTAAFFHIQIASVLSVTYLLAIEYIFFVFYMLCALVIIISLIGMWSLDKLSKTENDEEKALIRKRLEYLDYVGRIVHPLATFVVIGALFYAYIL